MSTFRNMYNPKANNQYMPHRGVYPVHNNHWFLPGTVTIGGPRTISGQNTDDIGKVVKWTDDNGAKGCGRLWVTLRPDSHIVTDDNAGELKRRAAEFAPGDWLHTAIRNGMEPLHQGWHYVESYEPLTAPNVTEPSIINVGDYVRSKLDIPEAVFSGTVVLIPNEEQKKFLMQKGIANEECRILIRRDDGMGWRIDGNMTGLFLSELNVKADQSDQFWWVRNEYCVPPPPPKSPEELKKERDVQRKDIEEKLTAVVLPAEIKQDITAQIIMHNEKDRLFKDWGLGDVIEYGRATALLFHGGPGTGKTYMARKIAEALGVEMISAMFGDMQSPMPGEYEANLRGKFAEAKKKNAILFFDECDGILQSRVGMGQIMSAENNCLLQEIEKYEGVLILATNRVTTLDEALERRLSLVIEFPAPDEEARRAIWRGHLPEKMPLGEDVQIDTLAQFELTGGQIKNVVLNAARFAVAADKKAVDANDFAQAVQRVLEGKKAFTAPRENGRNQWSKEIIKG